MHAEYIHNTIAPCGKVDEVDNMIFFIGPINKRQFSSPKVSSTFSLKMSTLMKHFIATFPFGNI